MSERTKDELVRDLELLAGWNPTSQRRIDICEEAADFILSMPEEQNIVNYPPDITTRWLEHISGIKHSARATGKTSPIHNLTSVESILKWWEEEIRPGLVHGERRDGSRLGDEEYSARLEHREGKSDE